MCFSKPPQHTHNIISCLLMIHLLSPESILTPPSLEVKFEYQQSGSNKRGIQTYYLSTWCIFNGCINYTVYYINLHFDTRQGSCCPKCLIDPPVFILRRFYPSIDNENQVPIIFSVVLVNI